MGSLLVGLRGLSVEVSEAGAVLVVDWPRTEDSVAAVAELYRSMGALLPPQFVFPGLPSLKTIRPEPATLWAHDPDRYSAAAEPPER